MVKRNDAISCFVVARSPFPHQVRGEGTLEWCGIPFELTFCVFLSIDENVY